MSYMKHTVIIITGYIEKEIKSVHAYAKTVIVPMLVSEIQNSIVNSEYTFFISPDGSKDGWRESDLVDKQRSQLKKFIRQYYEVGIFFVEVEYSYEHKPEITDSNYKK